MKTAQKQRIYAEIAACIAGGESQANLSRRVGASSSNVSQIQKTQGDGAALDALKIQSSYWRKLWGELRLGKEIFHTQPYINGLTALGKAKERKFAMILEGVTGIGKSTLAKDFAAKSPDGTWVVVCRASFTAKQFLREVAKVVGAKLRGSDADIEDDIARVISLKENPVLIIDEAENLKPRTYDTLKTLYDKLEFKAGIVLCAMSGFADELKRRAEHSEQRNDLRVAYQQVARRFRRVEQMGDKSKADFKTICAAYDITDMAIVSSLYNSCANYGDLFVELNHYDTALAVA